MRTDDFLQHAADNAGPRGRRRLVALIDAAKVPARPGELAGEEALMAAFRTHAARPPVDRQSLKGTLARLLTIKVGALCAAVLSVGGVAVAASTGTLPGPLAGLGGGGPASAGQAAPKVVANPARASHPTATPALVARCHDYLGWDQERRRLALGQPDFRDLVEGARGKDPDAVESFCGQVAPTPSPLPSRSPRAPLVAPTKEHNEPHPPGTPDPGPGGPADTTPGSGGESPTIGPTDQPSEPALQEEAPPTPPGGAS